MNFTETLICIVVALAVVSGLNIFAGSVFSAYNTSAETGMEGYVIGSDNSYVAMVREVEGDLTKTVEKVPDAGFLGTLLSGIFWTMDAIKTFLRLPGMLGGVVTDVTGTAGESGLVSLPSWFGGVIILLISIMIIGYLLYLLIGKGERHGNV